METKKSPSNSSRRISDGPASHLLLKTSNQLLEFFRKARGRTEAQLRAASLARTSQGHLHTTRNLACGLALRAESVAPKTVILRISFDPRRFLSWRDDLGPIELFYANPFGIELTYKDGMWGLFVDERRLCIDLKHRGAYEVVCLRIQDGPAGVEVCFAEDTDLEGSDLDLLATASRTAARLLSPRPQLDPLDNEELPDRLLAALGRGAKADQF